MNTTYQSPEIPLPAPENLGWYPLHAITGLKCGSLVCGAFWLTVFALALTG